MSHPTWQLELESGALVLTPCPGTKGVALQASLEQLKEQGVQAVVTALDNAELESKNVSALGEITQQLGMKWFQIEIEDDCAPDDAFATKWQHASPELHAILVEGGKVAMHCMGGSGRTGLFAAHLLLEKEWALDDIVREVQALRPGAFTKPVQVEYIERVAQGK
ncbi:cyclin-dependent kinase inhibitor 3 family protein [Vibrio sp. J1-1]|uniref:cyclin-dependent kinase inhibitor 3 family protein n=1 Tax=Vibrio sp. J1-1 TaxID=2912251 RepID=UPI001F191B37|nr:cyclin-dependent kinase inhibitor 3 family protein [Vibrio sp. J1-1]MBR9876478.1 phosphatase [Vibrionaceae bacterium]MCF7484072.1 cyclin-dependent kinase inhibitor 3 family protein [Vibrio sp. J1-1]